MTQQQDVGNEPSILLRWVLAATSCMLAESATIPLDVTKTRLQLQIRALSAEAYVASKANYGMVSTAVNIYKSEGWRSFYNGLSASCLRQAVYGGIGIGFYSPIRQLYSGSQDIEQLSLWRRVLAACTTGGLGQAIASPIDVVKVRLQADGNKLSTTNKPRYNGTIDAFRQIFVTEGWKTFFSGALPNIQRAAIINGCGIATYDHSKQLALHYFGNSETLTAQVIGSCLSGFVSAVVSTPFDVIRTRMMNYAKTTSPYKGSMDCATQTVRHEGILALYRGFVPAYVRLAPWQLVFFTSFEFLSEKFGYKGI